MGIIFFVLTAFVVPVMPAGATVPRWAFLSVVCAALLFKIELPLGVWPLIGYMGIMALVAPIGYEAAFLYWHFLLYAVLFLYAQRSGEMRSVAIGVGLAMALNSVVVLLQVNGFTWIPVTIPNTAGGLFYNRSLSSDTAGMAAALLVGYRIWWLVPGLLPTLIYGSRTPILALGVAGFAALWTRDKFWALMTFLGAALCVAVIWSYRNNGMETMEERIGVWQDMLPHLSILGHGLGSFITEFPAYQQHSATLGYRYENPHNDFLQIVYELGVVGFVLVLVLARRMAQVKRGPEWYCLLVFLVEGCFGFPLYEPVTGGLAAFCAGRLFIGCAPLRDLFDAVGHRIRHRPENHAGAAFRGGEPPVSAHSHSPVGGGLHGDPYARSVEDRYRRAGHPL